MVLVFLKYLNNVSAAVVSVDGQPVKLQLCDTAGQVSCLYKHTQAESDCISCCFYQCFEQWHVDDMNRLSSLPRVLKCGTNKFEKYTQNHFIYSKRLYCFLNITSYLILPLFKCVSGTLSGIASPVCDQRGICQTRFTVFWSTGSHVF